MTQRSLGIFIGIRSLPQPGPAGAAMLLESTPQIIHTRVFDSHYSIAMTETDDELSNIREEGERLAAAYHAERKHLTDTIAAMREALDKMQAEKPVAVQQAIAASNSEIVHLKETVIALREEMENLQHETQRAVQQAVLGASDEIEHLKATVLKLRDELEQEKF